MSDQEAWVADKIRKAVTFLVSAAGTWLLLRVLYRLAQGEQTLGDPELWGFVVLAVVATLWIRATRRMPRRMVEPPDPQESGPAESRSDSAPAASRSSREDDTPS